MSYGVARRNNNGRREDESHKEMANPEEQSRSKELPGSLYLVQTVYLWLRPYCETVYQINGRTIEGTSCTDE
jgi:hypothetical protein